MTEGYAPPACGGGPLNPIVDSLRPPPPRDGPPLTALLDADRDAGGNDGYAEPVDPLLPAGTRTDGIRLSECEWTIPGMPTPPRTGADLSAAPSSSDPRRACVLIVRLRARSRLSCPGLRVGEPGPSSGPCP